MNSTYFSSHFWLQIILIAFASLFFVWLVKTILKKVTATNHSEQAYFYALNSLALLLFAGVLSVILKDHSFFGLNEQMFSLSQSNFDNDYKPLTLAITVFGNYMVIFLSAILTSLWFAYKKQWRTFAFWLANLIIGYAITIAIKDVAMIPRPPVTDHADITSIYSFPSGHIVRVVLVLTFLHMLISPYISKLAKHINFFISGILIIVISLSRLFLEAHWLSDVIGSICLGAACAITMFTLYQRKISPQIAVKPLLMIFYGSWIICWAAFYLIKM